MGAAPRIWTPPTGCRVHASDQGSTEVPICSFFGAPPAAAVPAIVDATTASTATNGIVTLEVPGQGALRVRVVGIAARFPTVGRRFAVLDEVAMAATLDRIQPGLGAATEMWIAASNARALDQLYSAAASSEFQDVDHVVRTEVQSRLSGDTLAKAVMLAFLVSSLLCALLGAVAMILVRTPTDSMSSPSFVGCEPAGRRCGNLTVSSVFGALCFWLRPSRSASQAASSCSRRFET